MAKKIERERRFLVTELSPSFPRDLSRIKITQGYFDTAERNQSFRVRIYEDNIAEVTFKYGRGQDRDEESHSISLDLGHAFFKRSPYRLWKTRHLLDGWEIDFFERALEGVIFAEFEFDQPPAEPIILPERIGNGVDVTDSLSNLHLARLSKLLEHSGENALNHILSRIEKRVVKIVLTGPPTSGKSAIMELLKDELGDTVRFVPETASILIGQVGIVPGKNPLSLRRFQQALYRMQKIFEYTSAESAADENAKVIILDRGTVDSAAYLSGGLQEFRAICETTQHSEYMEYDLVLCLELPPREVYERVRRNNPAREKNNETYELAAALGEKLHHVWSNHPNFVFISNGTGWEDKAGRARAAIRDFLSKKLIH